MYQTSPIQNDIDLYWRDGLCRKQISTNQAPGVIYWVGDELTDENVLVVLKKQNKKRLL